MTSKIRLPLPVPVSVLGFIQEGNALTVHLALDVIFTVWGLGIAFTANIFLSRFRNWVSPNWKTDIATLKESKRPFGALMMIESLRSSTWPFKPIVNVNEAFPFALTGDPTIQTGIFEIFHFVFYVNRMVSIEPILGILFSKVLLTDNTGGTPD